VVWSTDETTFRAVARSNESTCMSLQDVMKVSCTPVALDTSVRAYIHRCLSYCTYVLSEFKMQNGGSGHVQSWVATAFWEIG
jgi:hypothetical protein